ncbi:MAG: hypothetical protein CM15mP120_19740 [Pseudomonadota bacterium]|nr:MAG: hypothetical protein CM15mP120_19740 [Pseudomonadota bacterium]
MLTADQAGPLADSMEHLRNIELACASNWRDLLQQRQATFTAFTEGLGYDLRRSLHSAQRLPAIAAYDENRCNTVLDTLQNTTQVPPFTFEHSVSRTAMAPRGLAPSPRRLAKMSLNNGRAK